MVKQSGIVIVHGFCKRCQRTVAPSETGPPLDTRPPPLTTQPHSRGVSRRGIDDLVVRLIGMHSYQPQVIEDSTFQSRTKLQMLYVPSILSLTRILRSATA